MKVFISSTYLDLKEYRREATNAILDAGMEPLLVENLVPGSNWNSSITQLVENADIFLIIIGFRIGVSENTERKKSWIEIEYEIARKREKPILTFMLSDDTLIRPSEIDTNIDEIKTFRDTIKSEFLVKYVSTPKDIYQNILISLLTIVR